jgi:REP element-mobilizing transposase RayT
LLPKGAQFVVQWRYGDKERESLCVRHEGSECAGDTEGVSFPRVKKELWGGEFWEDGYFARTVGDKATAEVKRQGKEAGAVAVLLKSPVPEGRGFSRVPGMTHRPQFQV